MKEESQMVEVYTSPQITDIRIAQTYLEDKGITTQVSNEMYLDQAFRGMTGVSLLVSKSDAPTAIAYLKEAHFLPKEESTETLSTKGCRPANVSLQLWSIIGLILLVLLLLALYSYFLQ